MGRAAIRSIAPCRRSLVELECWFLVFLHVGLGGLSGTELLEQMCSTDNGDESLKCGERERIRKTTELRLCKQSHAFLRAHRVGKQQQQPPAEYSFSLGDSRSPDDRVTSGLDREAPADEVLRSSCWEFLSCKKSRITAVSDLGRLFTV